MSNDSIYSCLSVSECWDSSCWFTSMTGSQITDTTKWKPVLRMFSIHISIFCQINLKIWFKWGHFVSAQLFLLLYILLFKALQFVSHLTHTHTNSSQLSSFWPDHQELFGVQCHRDIFSSGQEELGIKLPTPVISGRPTLPLESHHGGLRSIY